MQQISGKTALITGGSKGIGLGISDQLVRKGVNVVITGRHEESLAQAAQQLNGTGPGKAIAVVADVRDLAAQRRSVEKAIEAFGRLDVMVANAGVGHFGSILDLTPEQWHETIDINLTGVFNSIKAAAEALIESKGYFITIASLAGTNFFAGGSAYNASKFGVVGFTQAVMLDLRQAGVKCSVIMPGSVATYFNNHQPSVADAWKIQPEDIGQIVVDLLEMHPRTLPSKIEVRPSQPPAKG